MSGFTPRDVPSLRKAFGEWLANWHWHRFITLATNDLTVSPQRAVDLLKEWDGRMNRQAVGPAWHKRPDEALFTFAFLEKADSNPHWHCLVSFMNFYPGLSDRQSRVVDKKGAEIWEYLCPGGTADIQTIADQAAVADYVVKSIGNRVSYERFVAPDEFRKQP